MAHFTAVSKAREISRASAYPYEIITPKIAIHPNIIASDKKQNCEEHLSDDEWGQWKKMTREDYYPATLGELIWCMPEKNKKTSSMDVYV